MENNNNNLNKVLGQFMVENHGTMTNKQNKQNNINKVTKTSKKRNKVKKQIKEQKAPTYKLLAHKGINVLQLAETCPNTPRESFKALYNKKITNIENVTFFVKGFLPGYDNKYVVVENICSTKLLSWHCNIIVDDNPQIVNYIGKLITSNIEIYPYPTNPEKFSFKLIGEPSYIESDEWYKMTQFSIEMLPCQVADVNDYINKIIMSSIDYKMKFINDVISTLEYVSETYYGNQNIVPNLFLNTLLLSTDVDKKILNNEKFINEYIFDILAMSIYILIEISNKQIKRYSDLEDCVMRTVGIYTNSPYINKGEFTPEYLMSCFHFKLSMNQVKFYFNIHNTSNKPIVSEEERIKIINKMKQNIVDYSKTI